MTLDAVRVVYRFAGRVAPRQPGAAVRPRFASDVNVDAERTRRRKRDQAPWRQDGRGMQLNRRLTGRDGVGESIVRSVSRSGDLDGWAAAVTSGDDDDLAVRARCDHRFVRARRVGERELLADDRTQRAVLAVRRRAPHASRPVRCGATLKSSIPWMDASRPIVPRGSISTRPRLPMITTRPCLASSVEILVEIHVRGHLQDDVDALPPVDFMIASR